MRYFSALLVAALGIPSVSMADDESSYFVGLQATHLELRSVNGPKSAKLPGAELIAGAFITEYIRVEGRLGTSIGEGSPEEGLKISIPGYGRWLMGLQYPVTDYATFYGLYGFTYMKGKADHDGSDAFRKVPKKFVESSFSMSYAAGVDFKLTDSVGASFDFGRLHSDSISKTRTLNIGLGVKYYF
jgi:opacity protein-like surface antigen